MVAALACGCGSVVPRLTPKRQTREPSDGPEPEPAIEANPPQYHGMETPAEPDAGVSRVRSPLKRFNR